MPTAGREVAFVGPGLTVSRKLAEMMGGTLMYDCNGESAYKLALPHRDPVSDHHAEVGHVLA